ncbi:hypothetical protein RQP46_007638 [Phenoliferia psychrophenolica]
MASYGSSPSPGGVPMGLPQFGSAPPVAASAVPPGTLAPGTIVTVGKYTVRVDRFLSEGGFAHVYLATSETPIPHGSPTATTKHVLKRMAVPDKAGVEEVGKEVEVMRLLKNHPKIVNFIEASVSELAMAGGGKGYEIYILMEWCPGGGIIDMMNTRLQNRLTESEILKIFSDTVEAVAHMHYQSPPLIHRDLKVENILLSPPNTFKLCDFGSTTIPLARVPTAVHEIQQLEQDINRTTTLQYRAPELVDVWSRKGYDEKIDIWALGVFLYKLCYYTTPFEEHGPLAILNAQYKIPPYPAYSNAIKGLIGGMLQERASQRPNIYQVHEQVCRLRGTSVKIDNKYASSSVPSQSSTNKPTSAYSSVISSSPLPSLPLGPSLADTISPMPATQPERMVRTGLASMTLNNEWDAMSGPGGPKDGTSTSAPISAHPTASNAGFGDAFEPRNANGNGNGLAPAFGESFKSLSPSPPSRGPSPGPAASANAPSSRSASAAGLFSDLVAPSASASNANANANLSFEAWKLSKQTSSSSSSPSPLATGAPEPSFSPNYGLLKLDSAPPPPSSLSSAVEELAPPLPRRPPQSNQSQSQGSGQGQKTASAAEVVHSPLPQRDYPSSTKPELISRASQTSPSLLNDWKPPSSSATASASSYSKQTDQWRPAKQHSAPTPSTALPYSPPRNRKPMVDLLGDDEPEPPAAATRTGPPALPPKSLPTSPPPTANKRMSLNGESLPSRAQFRPTRPSETTTMGKQASIVGKNDDVMTRFPSLDDFDAPVVPASASGGRQSEGDEQWQQIVERPEVDADDDSSDDDEGPQQPSSFLPRRPPSSSLPPATLPEPSSLPIRSPSPPFHHPSPLSPTPSQKQRDISNLPPIRRPPSSESEGEIDLGPALSSIRKFAPVGNNNARPPTLAEADDDDDFEAPTPKNREPLVLQAPTPQTAKRQAAISSLVSRYESISNEPPPPPSKPASLRRGDSISSSASSTSHQHAKRHSVSSSSASNSWISPKADVGGFESRFPNEGGLESHFAAPAPPPAATKPLFTPRPSSSSSQRLPFKPVPPTSSSSNTSSPSSFKPTATSTPTKEEKEEEEEKFAGVANMKSRWEGIGRGGSGGPPPTGPGKPAVRKEWGVV